jgi:hypothetical protein
VALKPIETHYDGYRFRSRLEAKWAGFFNHLGIRYEYEKEGYEFDGVRYLPDFWLPEQDCWVEIKGANPTDEEVHKARLLAGGSGKPTFILYGSDFQPFEEYVDYTRLDESGFGTFAYRGMQGHALLPNWPPLMQTVFSDTLFMWGQCSQCNHLVISFLGWTNAQKSSRRCECGVGTRSDCKSARIVAAYAAARQA